MAAMKTTARTTAVRTTAPPVKRPPIHALIYGDPGMGKTTFAATCPKPMLVASFDTIGKESPYLRLGAGYDEDVDERGIPIKLVYDEANNLIVQVEQYIDIDPTNPDGYRCFLERMAMFQSEYADWNTFVVDSITYMEIAARKQAQYVLNKDAKDPRQWWGASTDRVEEMICIRCGSMPINVVVITHIDTDKDEINGSMIRVPKAPGRLGKGGGLPAGYSEIYRSYIARDDTGARIYSLQTRGDNLWMAETHIDAPDPCIADYNELWAAWQS